MRGLYISAGSAQRNLEQRPSAVALARAAVPIRDHGAQIGGAVEGPVSLPRRQVSAFCHDAHAAGVRTGSSTNSAPLDDGPPSTRRPKPDARAADPAAGTAGLSLRATSGHGSMAAAIAYFHAASAANFSTDTS